VTPVTDPRRQLAGPQLAGPQLAGPQLAGPQPTPVSPAGEVAAVDGRAWRGGLYAAVWLAFLEAPVVAAWKEGWSVRGVGGMAAVLAFSAAYLVTFIANRRSRQRGERPSVVVGVLVVAALCALAALLCVTVGQPGTATFVFIAVAAVLHLPSVGAAAVVAGLAVVNEVTSTVVPSWDRNSSLTLAVLLAALAMSGVLQVLSRNRALVVAHEENARLAVVQERNRFARDLHDILGHSLTVITVKAELAQRLLDVDRERAAAELADLERLSRDALADVRRAVEGYREMSLAGELARARSALASAEIAAELPGSTDEVRGDLRELFAWVVREGVTNVIRHSGARRCVVELRSDGVVVEDDGGGAATGVPLGHGLAGLRERAAAAGAVLLTSDAQPSGFRLEVAVR